MSYDITLNDPVTKEPIQLDTPHQMRGGMYAIGGTTEAWLNITPLYQLLALAHMRPDGVWEGD